MHGSSVMCDRELRNSKSRGGQEPEPGDHPEVPSAYLLLFVCSSTIHAEPCCLTMLICQMMSLCHMLAIVIHSENFLMTTMSCKITCYMKSLYHISHAICLTMLYTIWHSNAICFRYHITAKNPHHPASGVRYLY